jgi:hypothetical protein
MRRDTDAATTVQLLLILMILLVFISIMRPA